MLQALIDIDSELDLRRFCVPASPTRVGSIDLVPLLARERVELPAIDLLEDGLHERRTVITEVSDRGQVGEVRVRHEGPGTLLVLDGEEIVGAKQNRAFNGTFLVPAGGDVRLPVSCVERGRWNAQTPTFGAASRTVVTRVRAEKVRSTAATLATRGSYDSDQAGVWREVTQFADRTMVRSRTEALAESMATREAQLRDALDALLPLPNQIGLAAVAGDRLLAADIMGSPDLYLRTRRKIAIGLAGEVVDSALGSGRPPAVVVHDALREVAETRRFQRAAPGIGTTLVGIGARLVVSSLFEQGKLVHAVLVPA